MKTILRFLHWYKLSISIYILNIVKNYLDFGSYYFELRLFFTIYFKILLLNLISSPECNIMCCCGDMMT